MKLADLTYDQLAELRKAIEGAKMPVASKMQPIKTLDDVTADIQTAMSAIPIKVEDKI